MNQYYDPYSQSEQIFKEIHSIAKKEKEENKSYISSFKTKQKVLK